MDGLSDKLMQEYCSPPPERCTHAGGLAYGVCPHCWRDRYFRMRQERDDLQDVLRDIEADLVQANSFEGLALVCADSVLPMLKEVLRPLDPKEPPE